jgi:hypothetical protein
MRRFMAQRAAKVAQRRAFLKRRGRNTDALSPAYSNSLTMNCFHLWE